MKSGHTLHYNWYALTLTLCKPDVNLVVCSIITCIDTLIFAHEFALDCELNIDNGHCQRLKSVIPFCTYLLYELMSPPGSQTSGTVLTLLGSGFDGTGSLDMNIVSIGGVSCAVASATDSTLTCSVGQGPAGNHLVIVSVSGKGLASHTGGNHTFTYSFQVTGISPSTGGNAGMCLCIRVDYTVWVCCGYAKKNSRFIQTQDNVELLWHVANLTKPDALV